MCATPAGSSRPGCVQLGVSALITGAELQQLRGSFRGMVQQLASTGLGCGLQTGILGQLDGQAVLVDAGGSEVAVLDLKSSGAAAPQVRGANHDWGLLACMAEGMCGAACCSAPVPAWVWPTHSCCRVSMCMRCCAA